MFEPGKRGILRVEDVWEKLDEKDIRAANMDTSFESIVKKSLSSATSKHLSFDDNIRGFCKRIV